MSDDTPATRTDPALGSEGDADQLPREDTLVDRGVDDLLDEGYTVPERDRSNHWGETAWEEVHGEPLDRRLAEEEPEVWERTPTPSGDREELRAGRLVADDDAVEAGPNDAFAVDAGIGGGAASAEEAAVHLIEEEYVDAEDDDD
ncbi:DUF5709 domain-containing protein [Cellulomonas sp. S1-8]|uniref:DUF5709 domain-containing protein n=1 Tax=Cellulomonas sp. S1-8 TaxID=2904790 RepID=UPI002243DD25|nr:DUF5709 domain-containing protein [Cellulomonas sp. S1-8]UZN02222.1 DUF5709 domain-containing protein [Cellulomonas sp. S1-8]